MKRYSKILSLLLALCMVFTMLPLSALAAVQGEDQLTQRNDVLPDSFDAAPAKTVVEAENGEFSVEEIENPGVDLKKPSMDQLSGNPYFVDGDMVRTMVVLEDKALIQSGYSNQEIAQGGAAILAASAEMERQQDVVAREIEAIASAFVAENPMSNGISAYGLEAPKAGEPASEVLYHYTTAVNGMAVTVPYGILDEIQKIDGVKDAFLVERYDVPENNMAGNVSDPAMYETVNAFGTAKTWNTAGFTGKGMRLAVIDTGLDMDHPSFAASPELTETSLTKADIEAVLPSLNAFEKYQDKSAVDLTVDKLYRSGKVPYAFNYVDSGLDVTHDHDAAGDHGTHVAGIATANKTEGTDVVGVAPDAQLIVMKVFGVNGGAYFDDIIAAVEDCIKLNMDAVNLSLGSPAGFSSENPSVHAIYGQILENDMVVAIAAGNSSSAPFMNGIGTNRNYTTDPDNGIVSSPGTYVGATIVASVENGKMMMNYLVAGDKNIPFNDVSANPFIDLAGEELTYVCVPGYGEAKDYEGLDVKGKIALVSRGGGEAVSFVVKQQNAYDAGAIACLVHNNVDGAMLNMIDAGKLPNAFIDLPSGQYLRELAGADGEGTLKIMPRSDKEVFDNYLGGQMSDFSSWGVTHDLQLAPDVTAPGGEIFSTVTDGKYGSMSGTSMASPHIAGMAALVLQYLRETYDLSDSDAHDIAEALIMSTAKPLSDPDGLLYSPRKQGSGSANVYDAVTSPVYLTSEQTGYEVGLADGSRTRTELTPKASMGDDDERNGVYSFKFTLNNFSDTNQLYGLNAKVMTEEFAELDGKEYMLEVAHMLDDAAVSFDVLNEDAMPDYDADKDGDVDFDDVQYLLDSVNGVKPALPNEPFDLTGDGVQNTADAQALYELLLAGYGKAVVVRAGEQVDVNVTITLTDADKAYMDAHFPNGIYVEGFVRCYAQSEGGVDLSFPFMGFYGDWSKAGKVFDTGWYTDDPDLKNIEYQRFMNTVYTTYGDGMAFGLGINPYVLEEYDPAHNVLSPNGDGYLDYVNEIYLGMMRGGKLVDFTWRNAAGEKVFYEWYPNVRKSFFVNSLGVNLPMIYSDSCKPFTMMDKNGAYTVKNGDRLTLTVNGYVDDGDMANIKADANGDPVISDEQAKAYADDSFTLPVVIDTEAPKMDLGSIRYTTEEGRTYLTFTVSDNYDIAAVIPMTKGGSPYEYIHAETKVDGVDGETVEIKLDVTDYDASFNIAICDYGCNETHYEIVNAGGGSVQKDKFYGFRRFSCPIIGSSMYMTDQLNGWYSFETAKKMTMHTSQPQSGEPAVYAAEYVDGYVIGAENGGSNKPNNLFIMKAGSWDRIPFGNKNSMSKTVYQWPGSDATYFSLKYIALDMAFDYTTDTLYMLANALDNQTGFPEGVENLLLKVDYNTAKVELLGIINPADTEENFLALTLACDNKGNLYTINKENGKLYTIDKTGVKYEEITDYDLCSYTATVVGPEKAVYMPAAYTQSMTVDHETNKLYWAGYQGKTGTAYFFEVNKEDGTFVETTKMADNAEMAGLFKPYNCGKDLIADADKLTGLNISDKALYLKVGQNATLTVTPKPFNAVLGEVQWTSADETVATVSEYGIVMATGLGTTTITAEAGGKKVSCTVNVSLVDGTLFAYSNEHWLLMDAGKPFEANQLTDTMTLDGEVQAAAYFHGSIYAAAVEHGFDEATFTETSTTNLYRLDATTLQGEKLGSYDGDTTALAFNYKDGYLYGISGKNVYFEDYGMYQPLKVLMRVNPITGESVEVVYLEGVDADSIFNMMEGGVSDGTLAIDYDGNFYTSGYKMDEYFEDMYPIVRFSLTNDEVTNVVEYNVDMELSAMVYSKRNNGLLLTNKKTLVWADVSDMENVKTIGLGEIRGAASTTLALTVPVNNEPALPEVPATDFSIEETYKVPEKAAVQVVPVAEPWNASVTAVYSVADTSIATVNAEGVITGVKQGETTLTVTVEGLGSKTAKVVVTENLGTLYGYMPYSFGANGAMPFQSWAQMPIQEPSNGKVMTDGIYDFDVYAGAYYNGSVYAYAISNRDYGYYMIKVDPAGFSYEMLEARNPYIVKSMGFDYTTGTMFAAVEDHKIAGGLAQMDLETGKLTVIGDSGVVISGLTVDQNGTIYVVTTSGMFGTLDKLTGEFTEIGYTGYAGHALYQDMTYDFNNDAIYWAQCAGFGGSLIEIDRSTGKGVRLGATNIANEDGSCEVTCLFTIPENEPKVPETVEPTGVAMAEKDTVAVGQTKKLDAKVLPLSASNVDQTLTWTSDDENVVKVSASGEITGVRVGEATVTAIASNGVSADCVIYVTEEARAFYGYDQTKNHWFTFDETGAVEALRADAEDEAPIVASTYVSATDTLYSYDEDGYFYSVNTETFERTRLGEGIHGEMAKLVAQDKLGAGMAYEVEKPFVMVDMTHDPATGALYGTMEAYNESTVVDSFEFQIVELDPETGAIKRVICKTNPSSQDDYRPAALLFLDDMLYFIDGFTAGMVTKLDPSGESAPVQIMVFADYWGDFVGSRGFIVDDFTGDVYGIRDRRTEYFNQSKHEAILCKVGLGNAYAEELCEIGGGMWMNSLFIK